MTAGKGKTHFFEVVLPLGFPFKVAPDWRCPSPHEQRGKDRNTQPPLQKHHPWENPIDLWSRVKSFGSIGNHVQNKVMVQLWFGIRVKHLPVWVFIHYEWFYSQFQFDLTFPLNVHLKAKCWHPTLHFWLQGIIFWHMHIVSLKYGAPSSPEPHELIA